MTIPIEDIIKIPIFWEIDADANCSNILYCSNATGLLQLYIFPTDLSSKPKQLTYEKESVFGGHLSPNSDLLVYPMDEGGNEISHLLLMSTKGGDTKQLTENPQRTMDISWHPRDQEISRTIITMMGCGIETINIKTGECMMLKEKIPPPMDLQYSHDGKWIAYTSIKSFTDTEVSVINRNDPTDMIIYNIKQGSRDGAPSWSPNGKRIAIFSEGTGRGRVHIQEFQGEDSFMLELEGEQDANPNFGRLVWDPKGETVFYLITKHSQTNLHVQSLNGGKAESLPFPEGSVEKPRISKDGKKIVAIHSSMTKPQGIYLHEVGSNSISPLTSRDFNMDLSLLEQNQSIWYESFDGLKIHAWFTPAAGASKPYPAVIHAHGGPWGQVYDSWGFGLFIQACSQSGMAVLSPNFRGSTGYGAEFQDLDIGDPGGGDLEDVVYGAKWLKNKPEIDGTKLGITGASYGGYMTLMALTKKPDVFITGVSRVPVVDWLHMYKLADPLYQQFESELFGGGPRELKELYIDRSPLTHASHLKVPVMITAGKNDSRCPIEPIENLITKLKEMNHPHEFILLEKAGHISSFFNWEESVPIFTKSIKYLKNNLS